MMDWLFGWIDKILQSYIWTSFLSRFEWVDWFTVAFILVGLIYGAKQGLFRTLAEILELIIVILAVWAFYPQLAVQLGKLMHTRPTPWIKTAGFFMTAAVCFLAVRFVDSKISKLFHTKLAAPIKILGGALLGMVYAALFWSLLSQGLTLPQIPAINKVYEQGNSLTGKKIKDLAPKIYGLLPRPSEKK